MNKTYRVVLLLIAMAGLSSCLVKFQYFKHEPTHSFRDNINEQGFRKLQNFSDNGVVFVPDFTKMTPSHHIRSFLIFYSQTIKSIYINKVLLYSSSRVYKKKLILNKEIMISEKFKSFFTEDIFLFGDKDAAGLDELWNEDFMVLEVYYSFPEEGEDGELKKMEFKLERKTATDIAWST